MSELIHQERCAVGVDVASAHLDACVHGRPGVQRVPNSDAAIGAWLSQLPPAAAIGLESTGRCHERLARMAHARGFVVYLLNPRDVRHYARGLGARGKTDRLDAQVLARYVAREHADLRPWQPLPEQEQLLGQLLQHRAGLVKHRQAVAMSSGARELGLPEIDALLASFDAAIAATDLRIAQAAKQLDSGRADLQRITSVPGIGVLSGAALLGVFRRLPDRGSDAVIAFLGMDLRPMDSGQKTGLRRMSKRGNAEWRRLLFNAAMSASRTAVWRAFYERERAKGLARTAALNVLARRLVRVAFGLFKSKTMFDPARLAPSQS